MSLISWDKSYSVGIQSIDEQHKRLFNLLNALHDAMKQGKGTSAAQGVLSELVDYTRTHFAAEETMMQKFAYPGLEQHRMVHRELTARVTAFQEEYRSGRAALSVSLMDFLQSWLTHHIYGMDKGYSGFLCARGAA